MDQTETITRSDDQQAGDAAAFRQRVAEALRDLQAPVLHDPDAEDPDGDRIEFVKSGVIRAWVGGTRYRIRRPFFGELRALRVAWEHAAEEMGERGDVAIAEAADRQAEADRVKADEALTDTEREAVYRRLRREDRRSGLALSQFQEDQAVEWWERVFATLSLDASPGEMPAWAGDLQLPHRVIDHWRSVPLGRG